MNDDYTGGADVADTLDTLHELSRWHDDGGASHGPDDDTPDGWCCTGWPHCGH